MGCCLRGRLGGRGDARGVVGRQVRGYIDPEQGARLGDALGVAERPPCQFGAASGPERREDAGLDIAQRPIGRGEELFIIDRTGRVEISDRGVLGGLAGGIEAVVAGIRRERVDIVLEDGREGGMGDMEPEELAAGAG